jgi:SAM-dependent methyltransferase
MRTGVTSSRIGGCARSGSVRWVSSDSRRAQGVARSVRLFRAFRREGTDPEGFYRALAEDSVRQLSRYRDLLGCTVLDVGGGAGYFARAFTEAGAHYVIVDPEVGDRPPTGLIDESVRSENVPEGASSARAIGSGTALPLRTGTADVVFCSNVVEHVADWSRLLSELVRVARPGGIIFVAFTPWLSPWGGHETSPWHFLGGHWARRRYRSRHGKEPKNRFGENLFATYAGDVLCWVRRRADTPGDVVLLDAMPRYHPWWALWVARLPKIREIAVWNLLIVMSRNEPRPKRSAGRSP